MGFEYDDGNVEVVILGGINKETGKKNPTELTGYFLSSTTIKTKFGTKPLYLFKTPSGTKGVLGGGNLNNLMQSKIPGLLTHVINTGEKKDVGKGNPMSVYRVGQDRGSSIEVTGVDQSSSNDSNYESSTYEAQLGVSASDDSSDEDLLDEVVPERPTAPKVPAATLDAERKARIQAVLKNRNKSA